MAEFENENKEKVRCHDLEKALRAQGVLMLCNLMHQINSLLSEILNQSVLIFSSKTFLR